MHRVQRQESLGGCDLGATSGVVELSLYILRSAPLGSLSVGDVDDFSYIVCRPSHVAFQSPESFCYRMHDEPRSNSTHELGDLLTRLARFFSDNESVIPTREALTCFQRLAPTESSALKRLFLLLCASRGSLPAITLPWHILSMSASAVPIPTMFRWRRSVSSLVPT